MSSTGYNYERFDRYVESGAEMAEFAAFPGHLRAGDPAPDASLTVLNDGTRVRLSELWADRNLVVEFGSFT